MLVPSLLCFFSIASTTLPAETDLSGAPAVLLSAKASPVEQTALRMLVEEVASRTGVTLPTANQLPQNGPAILLATSLEGLEKIPSPISQAYPALKDEGYCLYLDTTDAKRPIVWIVGKDPAGLIFGVGHLLRELNLTKTSIQLPSSISVATSPAYPIRGHQLGFRPRANSWDGWDEKQFDRYIRELAIFGTNAIENIPFQDTTASPHQVVSRERMNVAMSEICARYGMQYWLWVPADFELEDASKREKSMAENEALYKAAPRIDGVFVPGGDPGDNHPKLVMPFCADLAASLNKHHPKAKVWLSLQGYNREKIDYVYTWLKENKPTWFGGIVAGPSSPPIDETRKRLDRAYGVRQYPDITHTIRCQYPVAWWDPAFAVTLGREPINPRPLHETLIHNWFAPHSVGSISYSDGVHDDVNKVIWSRLGWDPTVTPRQMLLEYCRFFFHHEVAESAADGILALERNWEGSLAENGSVDATLALWKDLETRHPALKDNWRWQMCVLRAYYDAYTRHRLLQENRLEEEANRALGLAKTIGADAAIKQALDILKKADEHSVKPQLRERVVALCDDLFRSIKLQTSVEKYNASGTERGCILDFLDQPLNNRWWMEDQLGAIAKLSDEAKKIAKLDGLRNWENPGPGGFYDAVGHPGKSAHVVRGEGQNTDPLMLRNPTPGHSWWDKGRNRRRLTWMTNMDWPIALKYENLDPQGKYLIRMTGYRDSLLRINGVLVKASLDGKGYGDFKEYPVDPKALIEGKLTLTWDTPEESHLNWREQSRVTEVWLIKQP